MDPRTSSPSQVCIDMHLWCQQNNKPHLVRVPGCCRSFAQLNSCQIRICERFSRKAKFMCCLSQLTQVFYTAEIKSILLGRQ